MTDARLWLISEVNSTIWQDVYKPVVGGRELYIKFTLDRRGGLLLISFKANPA